VVSALHFVERGAEAGHLGGVALVTLW